MCVDDSMNGWYLLICSKLKDAYTGDASHFSLSYLYWITGQLMGCWARLGQAGHRVKKKKVFIIFLHLICEHLVKILSNHYGTPMPPKDNYHSPMKRSNSIGPSNNLMLPGAHASSEGKRRRNRSNVEAMASKTADIGEFTVPVMSSNTSSAKIDSNNASDWCNNSSSLLPLVTWVHYQKNWERAFTSNGEPYFIDHNTVHHNGLILDCLEFKRKLFEDCGDDELPFDGKE
ncbi:membrane-associated guanylate kinase, WW and PDZ domain-containing protein 2 [Caerostris extrusa]|uniref:Membrane-associated guanylate kinase, WW and PDZ domain-containing protein 2 n=1 Tax=Caerostris extrusa TaxID=172846 RepID=A0AAV4U365_CAEEX|nr:membrane-associated guanylate kinase, WW and PDZ domain-containing protein 2 [Caerostris extrusa]